jgi:type I restriction enzyme, S subunit
MELTATKYKQTEVGLIPKDWNVIRLGDYISLKNGFAFKSEFFGSTGPIVMTPGNFKLEGGLKFEKRNTIRFSGHYSKQMCFENGDLIMVMTDLTPDCNLLGKSGIVDSSETLLHNQRIGKISITKKGVLENYLNIYFNSSLFSHRMKSTATGSTVRHTSVPTIKNSTIILPTLNEQKAIAKVLSDTDALIQALEKKIAKKKLIKKGVMQKLLTPKEGWEVKSLGELAEFYKGKGLPKNELVEEGKYKCVHYGELFTKYKEEIRTIFSKTNTTENCFFSKSNDVLMPTSDVTPNGLATASCIKEDNIILGGDVLVIRISNQIINGVFLSYYIAHNRKQVMQLVTGSTVYHLYGSDMSNFILSYPTIEEQNLIILTLSDMDKEISQLEQKLSKYQLAKQGMMQQLLTGKIRLV